MMTSTLTGALEANIMEGKDTKLQFRALESVKMKTFLLNMGTITSKNTSHPPQGSLEEGKLANKC